MRPASSTATEGATREQTTGWLVVNTHSHKEAAALQNLERQNFVGYCPQVRKTVRHARTTKTVLRPLFPGYIFVHLGAAAQHWRPVHSTFGVRRIIGGVERPSFIADEFIASLKAREIDGAITRPVAPYRKGQPVRMTSGAFEGLIATILDLDDKGRVTVLLGLLNQSIKVHTSLSGVREA